jgi:hypothetical protein
MSPVSSTSGAVITQAFISHLATAHYHIMQQNLSALEVQTLLRHLNDSPSISKN